MIADRMGEYVEDADAFNHYLESIIPENALLRAIRDAWADIKNLFKDAETKCINDMLEAIDALIDAGASAIKKIKFCMNNMGTYNISTNMEGVIVKGDGEMKEGMRLSDITGKPLAEKIMNGEGEDAIVFENGKG